MEPKLHTLSNSEASAVHALVEAFAALRMALPPDLGGHEDADLRGVHFRPAAALVDATHQLAESIAALAAGRDPAAPDDLRAAEDRTRHEAERMLDSVGLKSSGVRPRRNRREELAVIAGLLREVGIEAFDLEVVLATAKGSGELVLATGLTNARAADIYLLDRLYQRIEVFSRLDPLVNLERRGSAWFFERFSTPGRGLQREDLDFTRGVREQEWSLLDRTSIGLGGPIGEAYLDFVLQSGSASRLRPRQMAMLRALERTSPGVFRVERRLGHLAVFRDTATGRRYEVHEHSESTRYDVGFGGLGRLIPFSGGGWLRSPGMVLLGPYGTEALPALTSTLATLGLAWPALAIETAISSLVLGSRNLPRPVRPAANPRDATILLQALLAELREAGRCEAAPVDPDDPSAPDSRFPLDPTDGVRQTFDVDEVLADWVQALHQYSEGAAESRRKRAKERRGRKGKRRRR